jgi:DNA-binding transcriptional ArsR family regulator
MATEARRDVFQAIADHTRRQIINLLAGETMNLNSIAEKFDVSRPAISQHIKILTECGLIIINQKGRERYCEAKLDGLNEVASWAEANTRLWTARLDHIDSLLEEMQSKKQSQLKNKNKQLKQRK